MEMLYLLVNTYIKKCKICMAHWTFAKYLLDPKDLKKMLEKIYHSLSSIITEEVPPVVGVMAWVALFSGHDWWNNKIIDVIKWKWWMAWWRDRPLFLCVNREFRLGFTWCMKGEKVEKRKINYRVLQFI